MASPTPGWLPPRDALPPSHGSCPAAVPYTTAWSGENTPGEAAFIISVTGQNNVTSCLSSTSFVASIKPQVNCRVTLPVYLLHSNASPVPSPPAGSLRGRQRAAGNKPRRSRKFIIRMYLYVLFTILSG